MEATGGTSEKESPINKTIRILDERVGVLGKEIDSLSERLSTILASVSTEVETICEDKPKLSSDLDGRLDAIARRVDAHISYIMSIKNRLQI